MDKTFYEFIPWDLHKMLQDVTFLQVYTLDKISGGVTLVSCEMTFGGLDFPNSICSDEGLTLETSAFQIFHGGNSTFINSFDKTKFFLISTFLHVHYSS